jgi:NADH-quinone oxidoreductase subunit N
MTGRDLVALSPLLVLGAAPVVVMVAVAVCRVHLLALSLTVLGLLAALGSLWIAAPAVPRQVTPLLVLDHYALFYTALLVAASIAVALLGYSYFEKQESDREEFYVLLLIAALGASVLAASTHFVSFFLGLEILSVALYAMISYLPARRLPLEAGIKYLILAGSSSAFLLFGMALIYAELGTMDLQQITGLLSGRGGLNHALLITAVVLIVTGIGFKLAVVPFHLWTPDVYEGAPAPVTAFIATVSKGGMFALLLRYFYRSGMNQSGPVLLVFSILAIGSMFAGNLLALLQANVKRILAYSSIAHLGYLLVALQAGGALGASAATFYLAAYFITTLAAFGVVTVLSGRDSDADDLEEYRGLFWRRPVPAAIFTAALLSLAGIPVTAGFLGKFYIIAAGAGSAIWRLILLLALASAIGLYYYLRIVVTMYDRLPEGLRAPAAAGPSVPISGAVTLLALAALLLWLGIYPGPLLNLIRTVVSDVI